MPLVEPVTMAAWPERSMGAAGMRTPREMRGGYQARSPPFQLRNLPVSARVSRAIWRRRPVMDCSGVRLALGPPMSVFTQPGLNTTQAIPSSLQASDRVFQALFSAALDE